MDKKSLYVILAGTGALPFVACAILPFAGYSTFGIFGTFHNMAIAYGLAIVSFLCGSHWGIAMYQDKVAPVKLFVSSTAVTVVVWLAFLVASPVVTLIVMIVAFLALLFVDHYLLRSALITSHYFGLRVIVTTIVVISLFAIIMAL